MKVMVIGSGPAGIAAAKGLLEQGCHVTLLDVGNVLDSEKQLLLQKIQQNDQLLNTASLRFHANGKNRIKLPYGSNFIFKDVQHHFSWETQNCYFQPSFAQGGLSNVWGSVLAKYTAAELANWPVACQDLSVYYAQIISWLENYYIADTAPLLSRQANYLKHVWHQHQSTLKENGFTFAPATLAVDGKQCHLCGECQYGCPYELIYHSSIHLNWLKKNVNFTYINEMIVNHFIEKNQQVEVIAKHQKDQQIYHFTCDRLFVACGANLSSLLYLRALNQPNKKLILKDSQHFILPCLLDQPIKKVTKEPLHTLCQLKMSLTNEAISQYPVYLQLYTYMNLYIQEIKHKLKWFYPIVKPLLTSWIERLVMIQGYVDARESNQLTIQYQSSGNFMIRQNAVMPVANIIKNTLRYLKQHQRQLAFKPLGFLLHQSLTGQSNHAIGSLAMADHPEEDEVDIWGRPHYFERIHFVDGSILPSMPAGPITLTIMANAYRIGKEVPL